MPRKLIITVDDAVYEGLLRDVGRRSISRFVEGLLRTHVLMIHLERAYAQMSSKKSRETKAAQWIDALLPDVVEGAP